MNIPEARKALENLGFTFPKAYRCHDRTLRWGMTKPESTVDITKFRGPLIRDVFIARLTKSKFYITSDLTAVKNGKRVTMLNIYGGGRTLNAAIRKFTRNFKQKEYNISR